MLHRIVTKMFKNLSLHSSTERLLALSKDCSHFQTPEGGTSFQMLPEKGPHSLPSRSEL